MVINLIQVALTIVYMKKTKEMNDMSYRSCTRCFLQLGQGESSSSRLHYTPLDSRQFYFEDPIRTLSHKRESKFTTSRMVPRLGGVSTMTSSTTFINSPWSIELLQKSTKHLHVPSSMTKSNIAKEITRFESQALTLIMVV